MGEAAEPTKEPRKVGVWPRKVRVSQKELKRRQESKFQGPRRYRIEGTGDEEEVPETKSKYTENGKPLLVDPD
jgi:hypothetical protein